MMGSKPVTSATQAEERLLADLLMARKRAEICANPDSG